MTTEEEHDLSLKRIPGGIESLEEKDQERVRNARDVQLERALDLLKGISLYSKRAAASEKVAHKTTEKVAVR